MFPRSTSESLQASRPSGIVQDNESVFVLYKPMGKPCLQILFFHGLQQGEYTEAHWSAWQSGDRSCVWPQKWLAEEFPKAEVFCVSYTGGLKTMSYVNFDMFFMTEIVMSDLIRAKIGQVSFCPVVLVGHSIGGLLIKELCCHADGMPKVSPDFGKPELENFSNNLKGIAFYATPHGASVVAKAWAAIAPDADVDLRLGDLRLKFFLNLLKDIKWLDIKFNQMSKVLVKLLLAELWEYRPTKSEERRRRGDRNLQNLPEYLVGIDEQQRQIIARVSNVKKVGLVGVKGKGKSTLAMAVFNELGPKFEYSCFVSDVRFFKGDVNDLKDHVWNHMHRHGEKIGHQPNWSELEGKELFLVLGDISDADDRDRTVLSEIVRSTAQESRFILTSRDLKLLHNLGDVASVQFLGDDSAEQLFINHALPNCRIPSFLRFARVVNDIIKHCEGLPPSLEALGKYLSTKKDENDWIRTLGALEDAQKEKLFNQGSWEKLRLFYEALEKSEQQIFEKSIRGGQQHFKNLLETEDSNYKWYDDPLTWDKMCDPVMCSDGRTYDRWTIIDKGVNRSPFDRKTLAILGDNIDVRSKLFEAFPEQEFQFRERRRKYKEEALQHARAFPNEVADAMEKLTDILKWLPLDEECQSLFSSLLNRVSQESQSPLQENFLSTVSPVTYESQISPPEIPEDIVSRAPSETVETQFTSRMPQVSPQEGPASEIPMVSYEDVIIARGLISHDDLIRLRGESFESRLITFMVFLYIAIMLFIV